MRAWLAWANRHVTAVTGIPTWVEACGSRSAPTEADITSSPPAVAAMPIALSRRERLPPTLPSPFPMGMRSAAAGYSLTVSTDMNAYDDLSGHHLTAICNLIASTSSDSYPESATEVFLNQDDPSLDPSQLQYPDAHRAFQAMADYCLTCSDDSSDGDFDPTHECFVILDANDDDVEEDPHEANPGRGTPPVPPGATPPPAAPAEQPHENDMRSHALAQRAQLEELEAKIEQDCRAAQALRTTIEGGHPERGERALAAGRMARARIENDDNIDNPLNLPRTSQKLVAAVALLRAMPEPSSPERRRLRQEAQHLVELAAVQQAESSASRIRH